MDGKRGGLFLSRRNITKSRELCQCWLDARDCDNVDRIAVLDEEEEEDIWVIMSFSMRLVFIKDKDIMYVCLLTTNNWLSDRAGLVYTERHQRRLDVVECDTVDYIASLFDDEENICITCVCH